MKLDEVPEWAVRTSQRSGAAPELATVHALYLRIHVNAAPCHWASVSGAARVNRFAERTCCSVVDRQALGEFGVSGP